MSEELENKKPQATLIKHAKSEPVVQPLSEVGEPEKKKTVVVVKKKTVVKKKVVAHKDESVKPADSSITTSSRPEPVESKAPSEKKLSPDKITEFMSKRPQEMRRIDPSVERPKPEGLRIESGRPPRTDRPPMDRGSRSWNDRPNGDRSGPQGQPNGPRPYGDRPPSSGPSGQQRPWGDRSGPQGQPNGPRPYGDRPPSSGPSGQQRPWGDRSGPGGPNRPGMGRPGAPGAGRPGGFGPRPNGGRPGTPPPTTEVAKKIEPKKFRSKKEKSYNKEKEELFEKALQQSKKQANRANPIPKEIEIMEVVTVSELARKMNLKASDLISKLMSMGMMVTINEQIDAETASILAGEYGTTVKIVSLFDETLIVTEDDKLEDLEHRPPIVTIMGHVDHGKTKLLDAIRTTDVAGGEHGGITQHIGAYMVHAVKGDITFLDTPGHEAFTLMRARGAQVTDIVVLVVAANDGVMPQTIEAINHAKDAKVPIIVAINKIDLPEANPDRVRQQLSEYGLVPENWGGQTMYCEISALKKLGLEHLLETILLQAEVLELTASKKRRAEGHIIESKIDQGRGVVASVLVQKGVLRVGDYFIGGVFPGKIRALFDDHGKSIKEAYPSTPVEVLGFDGIPNSGDPFQVTESEREAKEFSEKRQELHKVEVAKNVKKITLANLFSTIKEGAVQELKVIIKGDVHGSVEALKGSLEKLSTAEIRLNCIQASAGAIIESDIYLAAASSAIIIGFHVRPTAKAQMIAERERVEIRKYNIIYDAVEDIRQAMEGMLEPELREDVIGQAEVRDTFKVPKIGLIAGCMVIQGKVKRNASVHLIREGVQIFSGKIGSLRRFKDEAKEVAEGYECGIGIENFQNIEVGDIFEIIEIVKIAKKLGEAKVKA